jgi:hypothetical protein
MSMRRKRWNDMRWDAKAEWRETSPRWDTTQKMDDVHLLILMIVARSNMNEGYGWLSQLIQKRRDYK